MPRAAHVIALIAALAVPASAQPDGQREATPYPISGYWMFERAAPGQWAASLDLIRQIGADTVIQFGHQLSLVAPEAHAAMAADPAWCIRGVSLLEATEEEMHGLNAGNALRHVLTLSSREDFGERLIVRPGLDRCFRDGDRLIWRLILPADAPGDRLRDVTAGGEYDLVLIRGGSYDSVVELLDEAGKRGMQVFVGMPTPPNDPRYPWDPWMTVLPDVLEVTWRVLEDYAVRLAGKAAFGGIYQTRETPVNARPLAAVLALYRRQHPIVRAVLPGKSILVSPYWDARIGPGYDGSTPEQIREGIRQIGRCSVDIIAPQDSRGTGKVGLFWPHEASEEVDPRLGPSVGTGKYGERYRANTRAYYEAARAGVDDLAGEGVAVELWANLEAFEPGAGIPCGSFTDCQRTTKERLDRAVMFAGPYPSKLISYMWDSLYTCRAGHPSTLGEEIAAQWQRPVLVDAAYEQRDGQPGLRLLGYHTAGCAVDLKWTEAGQPRGLRVAADATTALPPSPAPGGGALPPLIGTVWVPCQPADERLSITLDGPAGHSTHPFWLEPD